MATLRDCQTCLYVFGYTRLKINFFLEAILLVLIDLPVNQTNRYSNQISFISHIPPTLIAAVALDKRRCMALRYFLYFVFVLFAAVL